MTDRYIALTVILEKEKRDDDAQSLIEAIKMMKGVLEVKPHMATVDIYWAKCTAARELRMKLLDVLEDQA